MNSNPDIVDSINPDGSHTALFGVSVGGRKRRYKSIKNKKNKKSKLRKYRSRRHRKSRKHRRSRRQRGGLNPTYRSYTTSFEPGLNGMYANGPSVGKIIEQFN
jgi:transposase